LDKKKSSETFPISFWNSPHQSRQTIFPPTASLRRFRGFLALYCLEHEPPPVAPGLGDTLDCGFIYPIFFIFIPFSRNYRKFLKNFLYFLFF
jgi:hypothetical protein